MTLDEGVIKFDFSDHCPTESVSIDHYTSVEFYRSKLFAMNLIGFYSDHQVGYGNISRKLTLSNLHQSLNAQFIISGTQTGHLKKLTEKDYTYIVDYCIANNSAKSIGPILPSSESLTHAAIYESDPNIGAVIHIHNKDIWSGMINGDLLYTEKNIPYGTVQMAQRVKEIITDFPGESFAMAGHEDGVITYGVDLKDAFIKILELYSKFSLSSME